MRPVRCGRDVNGNPGWETPRSQASVLAHSPGHGRRQFELDTVRVFSRGRSGRQTGYGPRVGWYAYAPLSQAVYPPRTGLAGWLCLIIWLVLIGLWAVVSVRLLRPSAQERTHD